MLGATWQMRKLYADIERFAPLREPVLILGETGTGKGLVAKALHNEAHRLTDRRGAFVHFNSAAFNAGIIEDALFGHVRGAFSTAHSNQKGLIEAGRNGSVFVDEIGDLDLGLQAKLLDVVENKRVRPLGDTEYRNVDVRFIFATNRKMERLVEEGKFREDLFARINVLPLELPPLRLRKADIPLLVEHFVKIFNEQYYKSLTIDAGATDELFRYDWPRNVRELQSVLFKAAARAGTAANITHFILSDSIPTLPEPPLGHAQHAKGKAIEFDPLTDSWPSIKEKTEEAYFKALAEATQNIEQAMNLSNIGRARLFALFKKHKLQIKAKSSTTDIY
jgi:transcriptional regulator with GAF, ATPase, and Fis domain